MEAAISGDMTTRQGFIRTSAQARRVLEKEPDGPASEAQVITIVELSLA
jgi:hypothetical protein